MAKNYHLDFNRNKRLGFPEVVYGTNKDNESLLNVTRALLKKNNHVLITRLQPDKHKFLASYYSETEYDSVSGACIIGRKKKEPAAKRVAILSGGTSDEYIVNEIYYTLKYLNIGSTRFQDVGISGIHRVLNIVDKLCSFDVLIVVAGFEGALPTVVGGLVPCPIIAVPASIGYGVASNGKAALNSMLSSCANGLTVVNIDNGYGAALAAYRIIKGRKIRFNK